MKKLFLDFVFWKSPGKTHFHSVDCSISVHSVLRTPCTEKEQSTPWKWFYLTFSRKLHKKLLFFVCGKRASLIVDITLFLAPFLSGNFVSFDNRIWNAFHNKCDLFQAITWLQKSCQVTLAVRKVERKQYPFNYLGLQMNNSQTMNKFRI